MEDLNKLYSIIMEKRTIESIVDFLFSAYNSEIYIVKKTAEKEEFLYKDPLLTNDHKVLLVYTSKKHINKDDYKEKLAFFKVTLKKLIPTILDSKTYRIQFNYSKGEDEVVILKKEDLFLLQLVMHQYKNDVAKRLLNTFLYSKITIFPSLEESYEQYKVGDVLIEKSDITCCYGNVHVENRVKVIILSNRYLINDETPLYDLSGESVFYVFAKEIFDGEPYVYLVNLPDNQNSAFLEDFKRFVSLYLDLEEAIYQIENNKEFEYEILEDEIKGMFNFNVALSKDEEE